MNSFDMISSIETAPVSESESESESVSESVSGPVSAAISFSINAFETPSFKGSFKYTRRHVTPLFRGIAGELNREEGDPIVGGLSARE